MCSADEEQSRRHELLQALPAAAMKAYVPGTIWARIHAGDPHWIIHHSEEKPLTLLVIRMWAPQKAPLMVQASAYTACISIVQRALYRCYGTFKHMVQDDDGGCTVSACLGMAPFEHSEVICSRGALVAALEVRNELRQLGVSSVAAIKTGMAWSGAVGSDNRREYAVVGGPVQLATQMIGFT